MTVRELREFLEHFDEDTEVMTEYDGSLYEADIYESSVRRVRGKPEWWTQDMNTMHDAEPPIKVVIIK
jgi:hypothetical protein